MKRLSLIVLVMGTMFFSCGKAGENTTLRTADPCNAWARAGWQQGADAVVTPELRDGNASHLWPAEIIFYSVIENSDTMTTGQGIFVNPILLITYLENADLLSKGKEYGDFELRLLKAVGYSSDKKKYNGFYPQLVASTYQWRQFQKKGLSFEEAQGLYPFVSSRSFQIAYAEYAQIMNDIIGTNFSAYPSSNGYYRDFFGLVDVDKFDFIGGVTIANIGTTGLEIKHDGVGGQFAVTVSTWHPSFEIVFFGLGFAHVAGTHL